MLGLVQLVARSQGAPLRDQSTTADNACAEGHDAVDGAQNVGSAEGARGGAEQEATLRAQREAKEAAAAAAALQLTLEAFPAVSRPLHRCAVFVSSRPTR